MVIRFNRQIGVQRNFVFALASRNSAYEGKIGALIEEEVQLTFNTIRVNEKIDLLVRDYKEDEK